MVNFSGFNPLTSQKFANFSTPYNELLLVRLFSMLAFPELSPAPAMSGEVSHPKQEGTGWGASKHVLCNNSHKKVNAGKNPTAQKKVNLCNLFDES